MQTDSIVRRTSSGLRIAALVAALVVSSGCAKPPTVVHDDLLLPLEVRQPWLPKASDLAAAKLARAALVAKPRDGRVDPEVAAALDALEALPLSEDEERLLPLARDLRNATFDDPIAYRDGAREIATTWGLDPRIEGRLDRTIGDDPLRLAGRRQFDGWHRLWARTFNAVVEPIGNSAITGFVLAPYQLTNSLVHYLAEFSNSEPLSLTDRQALVLRKDFLARHPDTTATPALLEKIERAEVKLDKTLARRRLRASDAALESDAPALAVHHAQAAIDFIDRHPDENARTRRRAEAARKAALETRQAVAARRLRALEARPTPPELVAGERALATALLSEGISPVELVAPIADYRALANGNPDFEDHVTGRIDFVLALAQHESKFEAGSRKRLARAANENPTRNDMSRHARQLLEDDWQNPHGAFERLRRKAVRDEFAWRVAGEWVRRPRYPNLPVPVAYLVDAPTIAMTVVLAPLRALISPFTGGTPDFDRGAALAGYRYLIRYPNGEEMRPVIDWLYAYETRHERFGRALRLADWIPEFDAEDRAELVEKTASLRVDRVARLDRRDERASILRGVAREFPDSEGGKLAGLTARAEHEDASPQYIRISRSFLLENPAVAAGSGVGLNPILLNEDTHDGELHPDGLILRGGRLLEILLIAEGADEDAPAEPRTVKLSPARMRQLAAALDEAVQRNSLIDPGARQNADANRDLFLERAGLGLTDDVDARATAQSSFVYQSLRERYGMVRGRDSVLPFDLVFRGSLGDFSLGAFPRWRPPRETPDAFLYR